MIPNRFAWAFWLVPLIVAIVFVFRSFDPVTPDSGYSRKGLSPQSDTVPKPVPRSDSAERDSRSFLQAEIEALEKRVRKREQVLAQRQKDHSFTETASLNFQGLDPEQWSNKGYQTPYESVETLIYSAASGDLSTMIDSLILPPESEVLAKRLFESLPASIRQEQRTPESIIAMMTIDSVPLARAHVNALRDITTGAREVYMVFTSNVNSPQPVRLDLAQMPDSNWKVLVPPQAIRSYAEKLGIAL